MISSRVYEFLLRTVWLIYISEFGTVDLFHDLRVIFKTLPIVSGLHVTPLFFEFNKPEAEVVWDM